MKHSLRIITIGSIFFLCGSSFFGIVSMRDNVVSSGFWNIRQLVTVVSADDGMEDSNEDEEEDRKGERVQEIGMHTAPNGKRYTIMYDANSPTYMFRRPDGSLSSWYFASKNVILAYIDKNNPPVPVKSVAQRRIKKNVVIVTKVLPTTTKKSVTPIVKAPVKQPVSPSTTKVIISRPTVPKTIAPAPAPVSVPTPVPVPVSVPKIDTTTRVS